MVTRWIENAPELLTVSEMYRADATAIAGGIPGLDLMEVAGTAIAEAVDAGWPKGEVMVLGDNRNNSEDSRYWGFVPESYVIGKAVAVWMHWDFNYNSFNISRIGSID